MVGSIKGLIPFKSAKSWAIEVKQQGDLHARIACDPKRGIPQLYLTRKQAQAQCLVFRKSYAHTQFTVMRVEVSR